MNFQEAIENLFNFGDTAEAIVLGAILLITFLLGLLLWFLLAHLPQRNRLKKSVNILTSQLESLDKDHTELLEKHTVQSAKVQRLEEEATKNEIALTQKDTKLTQIQQLYTHLELERDKNYNFAEAAKRELTELKNFIKIEQVEAKESIEKEEKSRKERDEALSKVEAMKGLMEEMEADRHAAELHYETNKEILSQTQQELQEANLKLDALQKELEIAGDKLKIAVAAEDENFLTEYQQLKEELLTLQSELIRINGDKTELESRIKAYESLETDVKKLREEQGRMQELLAAAESDKIALESRLQELTNTEEVPVDVVVEKYMEEEVFARMLSEAGSEMEKQGFFTEIDLAEIIEDADLLQENLDKMEENVQSRGLENEINTVEISEDDDLLMNRALSQAQGAMNLQGFFGDIEEAVLLEFKDIIELDDDTKMERALDESANVFEKSVFFNDINPEEFIEDMTLLELQLQQEPETQARGLGMAETPVPVRLSPEEEENLNRALESAEMAMNEEGLYGNIDINQQLEFSEISLEENTTLENELPENGLPKNELIENNSIESELAAQINKLLPAALGNDDLKKINGIGSSIEEKLNQLGICTYEQVTYLKEPFAVGRLTAVLGLPTGSIEKDQWVYQAKQLLTKQKINDLTKDIDLHKLFKK